MNHRPMVENPTPKKIFLASSQELADERRDFEIHIGRVIERSGVRAESQGRQTRRIDRRR